MSGYPECMAGTRALPMARIVSMKENQGQPWLLCGKSRRGRENSLRNRVDRGCWSLSAWEASSRCVSLFLGARRFRQPAKWATRLAPFGGSPIQAAKHHHPAWALSVALQPKGSSANKRRLCSSVPRSAGETFATERGYYLSAVDVRARLSLECRAVNPYSKAG